MTLATANKQRVADMLETVFTQGETDRLADYWAPDTRAEAEQLHALLLAGFPDLQVTVEDMLAEDDRVAARLTFSGTHTGPFQGVPATGKAVEFGAIRIYQLSSGLITRTWAHQDALGLLRQLQG